MGHHRRGRYLIRPGFQFRFALFMSCCVLLVGMAYPFIVNDVLSLFGGVVRNYMGTDLFPEFEAFRASILLDLVMGTIALSLGFFTLSLFVSHRIVGPLVKLKERMKGVEEGDYKTELHLRKWDHFTELEGSFNEMIASLREKSDQTSLAEIIRQLEKLREWVGPEDEKKLLAAIESLSNLNEEKRA